MTTKDDKTVAENNAKMDVLKNNVASNTAVSDTAKPSTYNIETDVPLTSGGIQNATKTEEMTAPVYSYKLPKSIHPGTKIYNVEKSALNITARTVASPLRGAGDTGRGMSTTIETVEIGAAFGNAVYKRFENVAFKSSMRTNLNIHGKEDIEKALKEVNEILKKYNLAPINPKLRGEPLRLEVNSRLIQLRKKGINITELNQALIKAGKIGFLTGNKSHFFRKMKLFTTRTVMGNLKKCNAGQGLALTITIVSRGKSAIKLGVKSFRKMASATRIIAKKSLIMAAKASLKTAKYIVQEKQLQNAKIVQKASKFKKNATMSYKNAKITKAKVTKKGQRIKKFIKDPFGVRAKTKKAVKNIIFNNPLAKKLKNNIITKVIGTVLRPVFEIAKAILLLVGTIIKAMLIISLISIVGVVIIGVVISSIMGAFDFKSTEAEVRTAAIERIEECYNDDLQYISNLSSQYGNGISIKYEDVKDENAYKENSEKNKTEPFYQSTNCAEILSMATVKYNSNFKKAGKKEVIKYVEQLYHGSHEIVVKKNVTKDKDGKEVKSAVITYRTYYFGYLFDRQLQDSRAETITDDSTNIFVTGTNSKDDIYVALRDFGYTHAGACAVLANIDMESNFNPLCLNSAGYYGLFQWGGGRLENLKKYCKDKGYAYMSADGQIAFFFNEVETGSYKIASDFLKTSKNIDECTQEFCVGYEGCIGTTGHGDGVYTGTLYPSRTGKTYQCLQLRIEKAHNYDNIYKAYKKNYEKLRGSVATQVVKLGLSYVGKLHYVWGGRNLDTGCDCSGFVYALYQKYNLTVPSSSSAIISDSAHKILNKINYEKMKPGDVVVEQSSASGSGRHVTIYIGDKKFIGSNGNNSGCPQAGANPGGTPLKNQNCPNDCGYTTPGKVIGIYRYAK